MKAEEARDTVLKQRRQSLRDLKIEARKCVKNIVDEFGVKLQIAISDGQLFTLIDLTTPLYVSKFYGYRSFATLVRRTVKLHLLKRGFKINDDRWKETLYISWDNIQ